VPVYHFGGPSGNLLLVPKRSSQEKGKFCDHAGTTHSMILTAAKIGKAGLPMVVTGWPENLAHFCTPYNFINARRLL